MSRLLRAGLAFIALGSLSRLACQTSDPPAIDSDVYLSFFREAAYQTVEINGEPTDLVQPSIQDAIGIEEREGQAVLEAAADCEGEIKLLEVNARALVFESRLRAANEEKPSDDLANRLKELDARRIQIILSTVQRLKASLGPERFKVVDDYIRAHANGEPFFHVPRKPALKPK
jgi:hypothetical protein